MTREQQAPIAGKNRGRMLLSHNYDLANQELPPLNKGEFAQIFIDGLTEQEHISAKLIDNPHWIVEIIFATEMLNAAEVGKVCSQVLATKRQTQKTPSQTMPDILFLGGKKTTPALSSSPTSLQTGEWGVDVVETPSAQTFLASLQWDELTASKPKDGIFKVEVLGNS